MDHFDSIPVAEFTVFLHLTAVNAGRHTHLAEQKCLVVVFENDHPKYLIIDLD